MTSPNSRLEIMKAQQAVQQRKRSNSLEHLRGILRDCETFLPGTPERLSSLETMHQLLAAESKKQRSGHAHGSPAATGEALERFFTEAENGVGSLGLGGAGPLSLGGSAGYSGGYGGEFHMDDGVAYMEDYAGVEVKSEDDEMAVGGGGGDEQHHHHRMPHPQQQQQQQQQAQQTQQQQQAAAAAATAAAVPIVPMSGSTSIAGVVMEGIVRVGGGTQHLMTQQQQQQMQHQHHPVQQHHAAAPVVAAHHGLPPRPHHNVAPVAAAVVDNDSSVPERRLSHKEVEQRRREKAKQYFDELRSLLPSAQDSKFDKNSILQNSIQQIKSLRHELSIAASGQGRGAVDTSPLAVEYRSVFLMSRQCMAFAGLDGRIWEANQSFNALLGHTPEEMTMLTILSVTAREDSELSLQQGRRLLAREIGPSCTYNVRLVKKDTSYIQCTVELTMLEREGMPYCFLFCAYALA